MHWRRHIFNTSLHLHAHTNHYTLAHAKACDACMNVHVCKLECTPISCVCAAVTCFCAAPGPPSAAAANKQQPSWHACRRFDYLFMCAPGCLCGARRRPCCRLQRPLPAAALHQPGWPSAQIGAPVQHAHGKHHKHSAGGEAMQLCVLLLAWPNEKRKGWGRG